MLPVGDGISSEVRWTSWLRVSFPSCLDGSNGHCTCGIWSFFHRTCIGRVWPLHTSVILCTPHRVPFCHAFFCTTIRSCAVLWSSPTLFGSLSVCIILLAKSKIRLNLVTLIITWDFSPFFSQFDWGWLMNSMEIIGYWLQKNLYFDKSLLYSQKMKEGSPLRLISYFINIPGSGNKPYGLPARDAARWVLCVHR